MSRGSVLSLIAGLLVVGCLAQVAMALPDDAGTDQAGQVVVDVTPAITPEPQTATNASVELEVTPVPTEIPQAAGVMPGPDPSPVADVNAGPEVTEAPAETPAPVPTAEDVAALPPVDPTPEVTVASETPVIPEITVAPGTTVNESVTAEQAAEPAEPAGPGARLQGVRIAPPNPAFTWYLSRKNLSTVSSAGGRLGYIPSPVDLSHLRGARVSWANVESQAADNGMDLTVETADIQAGGYPATYDLRALGRVSGVRDQGDCGSCWAFASYGSLESDLLPGQAWDFSENNMLDNNLWDQGHCDGGNDLMAIAYLSRWAGPVNEKADPYSLDPVTTIPDAKTRKHVQDVYYVPGPWGSTGDYSNVKSAIMNYGGVYTLLWWDPAFYNPQTASYYYTGETQDYYTYSNHAVTLVGWDDNYDPARFTYTPSSTGAFIAKNSWGTGFGDGGFFYISYEDWIAGKFNAVYTAEPVKNYRHEYQWDDLGWSGNMGFTGTDENGYDTVLDTAWGGNVFTAVDKEEIAAVSFYTTGENTEYTAYVYTDPDNGPVAGAGPKAMKAGSLEFAGYHTVKFDSTVPVNAGQKFSVVIRLKNPSYELPLAVEARYPGFTSRAVAYSGESYVSPDGMAWQDAAPDNGGETDMNVCLKAFTVPPTPPPDARFTAAPKKGKLPLKVLFKDRSLRKPVSWLWDFGDGQTSAERNPVHTYQAAGTYTVTLTVKNTGGEDSMEKERLITVTQDTKKIRPKVDHIKKGENPEPNDDE